MTERIDKIKISDLIPFENHPFKARSGIEQEELSESIKSGGLLTPIRKPENCCLKARGKPQSKGVNR